MISVDTIIYYCITSFLMLSIIMFLLIVIFYKYTIMEKIVKLYPILSLCIIIIMVISMIVSLIVQW